MNTGGVGMTPIHMPFILLSLPFGAMTPACKTETPSATARRNIKTTKMNNTNTNTQLKRFLSGSFLCLAAALARRLRLN